MARVCIDGEKSREKACETTATRMVTVKPLIHTTARTIGHFSLIYIFATVASGIRTCATEVSSKPEETELFGRPGSVFAPANSDCWLHAYSTVKESFQ